MATLNVNVTDIHDIVTLFNDEDERVLNNVGSSDPAYRQDRLMQQLGVSALFLGVCTNLSLDIRCMLIR